MGTGEQLAAPTTGPEYVYEASNKHALTACFFAFFQSSRCSRCLRDFCVLFRGKEALLSGQLPLAFCTCLHPMHLSHALSLKLSVNLLECNIEVAKTVYVLNFILQPIVENALYHKRERR